MTPDSTDLAGSVEALESELETDPSPRAFAPLAEAYRLLGRLDDAIRTARQGASACPDHAGILIVLARALADSGDRIEALAGYTRVLDLDPENLEARAFVDGVRRAEPRPLPSASTTVTGPEVPDGGPEVVGGAEHRTRPEQQSSAESAAGPEEEDTVEAVHTTEVSRAGTLSEELAHLADLFEPPRKERVFGETRPGVIATLTLAEIYSRQGLNQKAAEVCERILEREPDNEEARQRLEEYRKHPASV